MLRNRQTLKGMTERICFFLVLTILLSCSKDDEVIENLSNQIIGSWSLTSQTKSECANPSEEGSENFSCTATWCFKRTFTSDGKYLLEDKSSGTTNTVSGTYTVTGNQLEISATASAGCGVPITINVSGSTLTLSFSKVSGSDCNCKRVEVYKKGGN